MSEEHAGQHPVERAVAAAIDAAVDAERRRIIAALGNLLQCPCCGEAVVCLDDCTFAADCPSEAGIQALLRDAVRAD